MVTNKKVAGYNFVFAKVEKLDKGYRAKYIVSKDKASFYLYFHGADKKISSISGISISKLEPKSLVRGIIGDPKRKVSIPKMLVLIDQASKNGGKFKSMAGILSKLKLESDINNDNSSSLLEYEYKKDRGYDSNGNKVNKYYKYDDYGKQIGEVTEEEYEKDRRAGIDKSKRAEQWMKIVGLATGLATIIGLLTTVIFMIVKNIKVLKANIVEKEANVRAEEDLNKYLFKGQNGEHPAFEQYKSLISIVENVIKNKNSKGCLLYGPPGTGKTYNVRRQFHFNGLRPGKDYTIIKGSTINIIDLYQYFYDNKDKILVLDDFDKALQDDDIANLLKAATDSYPVRILSLPQHKEMDSKESMGSTLPDKFKFSGKIIIVTNLHWGELNTALKSRLPNTEISFNEKSFLRIIEKMLKYFNPDMPMKDKQEVFDYLLELTKKHKGVKLDLRTFSICIDIRLSTSSDWKGKIDRILLGKK